MSTTTKQTKLVINLYRNLLKWCRETPSNLSLSHLNQKVGGVSVKNSTDLRSSLQKSFREENKRVKDSIQQAFDGLRLVYSIDPGTLPKIQDSTDLSTTSQLSTSSSIPKNWIDAVEWLPPMDEILDQPFRPSDLPLFPLSAPLIPNGDKENSLIPLFSPVMEVPVSGMETPLKIFEPRYREMYKDVLSDGSKRFVVPMAHPYHAGRFAKHGWLYQIMNVEDIADQTQGQIHLVAQHIVTYPVRIDRVVNPADWKTQSTYLRVQGEILEDRHADSEDLSKIANTLRKISSDKKHSDLAARLLSGLAEGSLWPLVSVWVDWLQMEALELQVKIAAHVQLETRNARVDVATDEMIEIAQAPFRGELESLLIEVSTLIPLLLQESPKEQCERVHDRIKARLLFEAES